MKATEYMVYNYFEYNERIAPLWAVILHTMSTEMENTEKSYSGSGRSKRTIVHYLVMIAIVLLIVYAVFVWVSQKAEIEELTQTNDAIAQQIMQTQQQCDEYNRILSSDDQAEYMERIAIEKYGYGYPGEHRYYFTNKE